jgi:Fur family transcriptional regulator, ferric uptake regulator
MKDAKQFILDAGLRPTNARVAVLNTLSEAASALSHPEVLERLAHYKEFDRVTIYRVLDWLTENHLVHKVVSENRAWKFQFSQHEAAHQHAHLECSACGKLICIHEIEPHFSKPILSKYQVESIDIHLKGICQECA